LIEGEIVKAPLVGLHGLGKQDQAIPVPFVTLRAVIPVIVLPLIVTLSAVGGLI
jgi:hypothetical protein